MHIIFAFSGRFCDAHSISACTARLLRPFVSAIVSSFDGTKSRSYLSLYFHIILDDTDLLLLYDVGQSDIKELAYDFYGNYTLQDCIMIAAKLRDNANQLLSNDAITQHQYNEALGLNGKRHDWLSKIIQWLNDH